MGMLVSMSLTVRGSFYWLTVSLTTSQFKIYELDGPSHIYGASLAFQTSGQAVAGKAKGSPVTN